MEDLMIFAGILAILAFPVMVIISMVWSVQLARRVRALEDRLEAVGAAAPAEQTALPQEAEGEAPASPAAPAEATAPDVHTAAAPTTPEPPAPEAPAPESPTGAEPPAPEGPPKAVVLRADRAAALAAWVRGNWIYVVSAVSLAAAGLFFVQYGIETGLLPPTARVAAALVFGAALVMAGETVRRRWGDREEVATAYLPSVFSGAGLVTLFGAILAALHLYALIPPGAAFAGLTLVAALGLVLGWFSGPLLAAIGLVGANAAPFVVGGESPHPELFYGYFALIAVLGLGIDAGRRWAWVSVLALVLAFPAGWLLYLGSGFAEYFAAYLVVLVLAATAIPVLKLNPAHGGATIVEAMKRGRPRGWPIFPTRLVAGSMLAASVSLALISTDSAVAFWAAALALSALVFAIAFWADRAEALEDLATLPAAALLALPLLQAGAWGDVYAAFHEVLFAPVGTPVPPTPFVLVAGAAALGLIAAWRSARAPRFPVSWAAGSALFAPVMMAFIEASWHPAELVGAYPWALTALALAALMTGLALVFARMDGNDKARISAFVLAALAMIALSLTLVVTETALTLALAVLTLAAALIDRRFDLRPLSVAVQIGAIVLAWRLIIDPGTDWAAGAPYVELALGYGGALVALAVTFLALAKRGRPVAEAVSESAGWTLAAVFASVLLTRLIEDAAPDTGTSSHWYFGLAATVWLVAAANQLWRTQLATGSGAGRWLARLRWTLAGLYTLVAVPRLLIALWFLNPLVTVDPANRVLGPLLANSLAAAYLVPALVPAFVARRFVFLGRPLRRVFAGFAALLVLLWAGLAIRHAWQGPILSAPSVREPELYSYTIALIALGAGLLWRAIATRSAPLRMLAMGVIALTAAKVFLLDAAGLVGLLRVFSFLALGLALAGLAFLNRWAASHTGPAQGAAAAPETEDEGADTDPEA